jgi:hypothetical protein
MNPSSTVDEAAFSAMHLVSLRPSESFFERPAGRVERIRMKSDVCGGVLVCWWPMSDCLNLIQQMTEAPSTTEQDQQSEDHRPQRQHADQEKDDLVGPLHGACQAHR